MAILDELTEQEVSKNKAIRGYIVRALAKGSQNALLVRQITNALVADGLIYSPDISKPIEYLQEAGYVTFTDRSVNAYNAYRKDSIIKLTRKGVDLVEGTINDPGIDVYWYEYKLTVIDRFGNPDTNYPALPGIKSKKQFKAGAVVAVALPYGDLTPAIIGEVEL